MDDACLSEFGSIVLMNPDLRLLKRKEHRISKIFAAYLTSKGVNDQFLIPAKSLLTLFGSAESKSSLMAM